MAPLHPLRHDARAFAARAGAALAVFFAIAIVLLAGGADQPLASAEAKGDTGAGDAAATAQTDVAQVPAPEPVLGELPPADPPVEDTPADPPSAGTADPAIPEPPSGAPSSNGNDQDNGVGDPGDPSGGGKDKDNGNKDKGSSGGHKGEDVPPPDEGQDPGNDQGGEPSGGGTAEEDQPPSGGGKGAEPTDDGSTGGSDDEPAPSGRPQVTAPAGQEPGATPSQAAPEPTAQDPQPGDGVGTLRDAEPRTGEEPASEQQTRRARFTATQGTDGGTAAGPGAGDGGSAGSAGAGAASTVTGGTATTPSGDADGAGEGAGGGSADEGADEGSSAPDEGEPNVVTQTVRDFVEVVPDSLKAALAALAALSVLLGIGYLLAALRARRLARQRRELLQEVGLLQTALLPPVPDKVGSLLTSVAYRPADGPGAGGDFYDVLALAGGRVGFILGDVSGHGRGALARTAFMRYTLRAYLEAGLEPRVALQVAGRVIDENLGGDFATVLLAVHDPETGSLTYATAGHPAPIVVGPQPHEPVTAGSSPPIGVGVRTGLRQTTVPLVPGSVAALFTDGLMEARTDNGILGRERLAELLEEIGTDASAHSLIERVAAEAQMLSDDMAAVVVTPTAGVTAGLFRTEQLELSARELDGPIARRFLEACGLPEDEVDDAERDARLLADRFGGVVLHVVFGNRFRVEVLPRNVESIEAASRRVSAGSAR